VWLSAATATQEGDPARGALYLTLAGLVWLVGYVFACWFWPFANCGKCKGKGRRRSPTGRAFRRCPRCKGSGRRLRTGRRIFNKLNVLHEDARSK
jgi:hypothetical protein